ncbi:SPOR domain-containing protein [Nitrosovibrio tenuis]|uniref:Sporulation related domain-containing protein n=1 Tax=Nitrosovibrio tenuis TaxID=1233 RepID=A0A1H7G6A0_9PROT|nr:SPOR domain-containing protein [Nitrosovibrio tenuis]SEK33659.1 Sporulation related domain-containing protein [Nitrosovibrio tenuis]
MSRDYKTHPNSSASAKSKNALLVGIFIGYALGLLSAIGTWMYINKGPSPFISSDKPDSVASKNGGNQTQKGAQATGAEDKAKSTDGKPRFEFYNILPNAEEPVTEQQLKQAIQQPASKDKYFLQAGSFQNASDADNLKAKLAMLGVEATVQAITLPEKGVWHRVRVGPFTNIDDIKQVRGSLQQNGVQSSLIKVHEGVQ